MSLTRLGHWLVYLLVRVFVSVLQALDIATCLAVTRVMAVVAYDVIRIRRKIVDENLAIALPDYSLAERQRVGRRMWRHLLIMICEIAHAPRKIHETNWRRYVKIHRHRELVTALLWRRPKVVVTAHFGNFEIAGYLTGLLGIRTHTVARTLDNPFLDDYVNRFRESHGQFILPKAGSAQQADAVLSTGGTLVLLGDQHAGDKGCWVDFMGRPASCHKALALFTLLNAAPMIVAYCTRQRRPMQFELGLSDLIDPQIPCAELADVKTLTQWYNGRLEHEIRRTPDQYWWVHNRWRDWQKRKRRKKKKSAPAAQQREAA